MIKNIGFNRLELFQLTPERCLKRKLSIEKYHKESWLMT